MRGRTHRYMEALAKKGDTDGSIKALRAVKRIHIPAGNTENVPISLAGKQLEWWNEETGRVDIHTGDYMLYVGKSSDLVDLQRLDFKIVK